eukprot:gnl/MRDRNA2_/MRDRNA2_17120_c0_seq1.p1 gnl/MRDRNA2_/MRDRNA2_17120_c0~~gnl/MRDRNA2_/MRDRNA2_17120_c0_seq1.p1  ORF type:complete len:270 (+),score=28.38 gnl/MRDRNA2_/MRDRNA2_17120_c0_seq1:70-879(+)
MTASASVEVAYLLSSQFDYRPQSLLETLLTWSGTAQDVVYESIPDPQAMKVFVHNVVMRQTVTQVLMSGTDLKKLLSTKPKHRARPWVIRVGRTSYVFGCLIETIDGIAWARVRTTMVAVDAETLMRPVPVPYKEVLEGMAQKEDNLADLQAPTCSARPANAFVWHTKVRFTDCDILQHITNARYGSLIEDARWAAAKAGFFNSTPLALGRTHTVCIEHTGQPHAGDSLDIAVWWDKEAEVMGFEFTVTQRIVATAALSLLAEPARSSL